MAYVRRERMEILLSGGKPWGFSIKGGLESNKPLVISKLEHKGKAECGGLYVGDVIHSINDVVLSGMRDQAIKLVKTSGPRLTLEIERGKTQNTVHSGSHNSLHRRDVTPSGSNQYGDQYYHPGRLSPAGQPFEANYSREENYRASESERTNNVHRDKDGVYRDRGSPALSESMFATTSQITDLNSRKSLSSHQLHQQEHFHGRPEDGRRGQPPQDGARSEEQSQQDRQRPVEQYVVKLRERKARDKGITTERPRSWHASKHLGLGEDNRMRSPVGCTSKTNYYQKPLSQQKRRSKGWLESGDLKSVFKGDVNGSHDSLISAGSHQSYRSDRLSVTSSRSSGAMSSSRGSLDNLVDNNVYHSRNGSNDVSPTYRQYKSPSKPQPGIVNHQKSMFERLSHEPGSQYDSHQYSKGSREDLNKISRVRRTPSEDSDSRSQRDGTISPTYSTGSRRYSSSPPPFSPEKSRSLRKNSHEKIRQDKPAHQVSNHYHVPSDPRPDKQTFHTHEVTYGDAKIVKTKLNNARNSHQNVPEPPTRDTSSHQAVINYQPKVSPTHKHEQPTKHPETNVETLKMPGRQERVFGVMAKGNSRNIVSANVTVSPTYKVEGVVHQTQHSSDSGTDYVSRKSVGGGVRHAPSSSGEFSDESDPRGKGRYGEIWKTPLTHRRMTSEGAEQLKAGPTPQEIEPDKRLTPQQIKNLETTPVENKDENIPYILKSLQQSKQTSGHRKTDNSANYEKLWLSESVDVKKEPKQNPVRRNKSSRNSYKNRDWTAELDDGPIEDDAFDTQDIVYSNQLKDMTSKVLRATSFTRKDLMSSPSLMTFDQKRKQFQFPVTSKQNNAAIIHSRSRSHGNEIDESSEPLAAQSGSNLKVMKSTSDMRQRPKSAGIARSNTSRHASMQRHSDNSNIYSSSSFSNRKWESLPRYIRAEEMKQAPPPPAITSPHNHRMSIDVRPDIASKEPTPNNAESRKVMLDFLTRKTSRTSNIGISNSYASSSSIHTSHSDETDKRKNHAKTRDVTSPQSSDGISTHSEYGEKSPATKATRNDHMGSVRRLKNFNETRAKFGEKRPKSMSSLLEEEPSNSSNEHRSRLSSSASLENLDPTPDESNLEAKNVDIVIIDQPEIKQEVTLPPNDQYVKAPPRRNVRNRHSNSSNASSVTTMSTLSSFSSSSSTSIGGRFPTLGEENPSPVKINSSMSHDTSYSSDDSPPPPNPVKAVARTRQIDTGTYRVVKGKKSHVKTSRSVAPKSPNSLKSSFEIRLAPSPAARSSSFKGDVASRKEDLPPPPPPVDPKTMNSDKVSSIIEKVKRSASFKDSSKAHISTSKDLPPPPPPAPLDGDTEQLLEQLVEKRRMSELPPMPEIPAKNFDPSPAEQATQGAGPPSDDDKKQHSNPSSIHSSNPVINKLKTASPNERQKPKRNLLISSRGNSYENVHSATADYPYENVFRPIQVPVSSAPSSDDCDKNLDSKAGSEEKENIENVEGEVVNETDEMKAVEIKKASNTPEISCEPLLPDVPILPSEFNTPNLTNVLIQGDKALSQVLSTTNKKTSDYMAGILPQSSHDIVEEGMRYRRRKPKTIGTPLEVGNEIAGNTSLPASSTYYSTSASKGKILNLAKEKLADGEGIPEVDRDSQDDINQKKVELILSINQKLDDLFSMKDFLKDEMKENEVLGKHVLELTKKVCSQREQEKYNIFVQDVDGIINLLLSLSGRLARAENAIQMLPPDCDQSEIEVLIEKRKKLTEQHQEAKQLKENIDKRQKAVSEILVNYFDQEQFADYEHYIKMKSALIMEQRELDDKGKLGYEQMQCLRESLSDDWQQKLEKLLDE